MRTIEKLGRGLSEILPGKRGYLTLVMRIESLGSTPCRVSKNIRAGLFLISLATLLFEVLLTRLFSATLSYHFSFIAVSLAMFGLAIGAMVVYLFPSFSSQKINLLMIISALLMAITVIFSLADFLKSSPLSKFWLSGSLLILVNCVPFFFSGICNTLIFVKYSNEVGRLYSVSLIGAAVGCIILTGLFHAVDALTCLLIVAFFSAGGAFLFALEDHHTRLRHLAIFFCFILICLIIPSVFKAQQKHPWLHLKSSSQLIKRTLFEKWNSFSYINISTTTNEFAKPFGWGLSSKCQKQPENEKLLLLIDNKAGTFITAFNGDLSKLDFLKCDIVNLGYYIRPQAKVLILGTGGGRDILSALLFSSPKVVGVEINKDILDAVNKRFGDFSGHLDKYPGVTLINDEARSYVARQKDQFDIIQISLTDTWAATSTGAYYLSENPLYTTEAWGIFYNHLTPRGILTCTRWSNEIYRLASLATASLLRQGIVDPRAHMVVVRFREGTSSVGTILVGKSPFSQDDIVALERVAQKLNFEIVLTPQEDNDFILKCITSGKPEDRYFLHDMFVDPPTDDRPFFFLDAKINWSRLGKGHKDAWGNPLVSLLLVIVMLIIVFFLMVLAPVFRSILKKKQDNVISCLLFFSCIGMGFMLIEISQLQRLTIFLGHPSYSLSVVLFGLLLGGGWGSYGVQKISKSLLIKFLFLLPLSLLIFGFVTGPLLNLTSGAATYLRILMALGMVFVIGLGMGVPFPLGMKLQAIKGDHLIPWLWGVNGATSVLGSVGAVFLMVTQGISFVFWMGFIFYVLAWFILLWSWFTDQKRKVF